MSTISPERRPLETRRQVWPSVLAKKLSAAGVLPNAVSVAGLVAGGIAAVLPVAAMRVPADPVAGALLLAAAGAVQLRLLCNMLDGLIAVECGRGDATGDFFNEVPDRAEDLLILTGVGWAAGQLAAGLGVAWLALATAYVRAYRASRGLGQDFCGPGAKPHRMFVVTVGMLCAGGACLAGARDCVPAVLTGSLALVGALTAVTLGRRARRVFRDMQAAGSR